MNQPDPFDLSSLHLTEGEHAAMRAHLTAHMAAHPLPREAGVAVHSPYAFLSPFTTHGVMKPFAYAFALLLMVGTGTAAAAEGALPGSPLYAVKIHVNERVQGALATSPEAKAAFAVEIADRRLTEATLVMPAPAPAANTRAVTMMMVETSAEVSAEVDAGETVDETAKRVAEAAKKAEEAIAALEATNPIAAAQMQASLDAAIAANEATLVNIAAGGEEDAQAVLETYETRKAAQAASTTPETGTEAEGDTSLLLNATTTASVLPAAEEIAKPTHKKSEDGSSGEDASAGTYSLPFVPKTHL